MLLKLEPVGSIAGRVEFQTNSRGEGVVLSSQRGRGTVVVERDHAIRACPDVGGFDNVGLAGLSAKLDPVCVTHAAKIVGLSRAVSLNSTRQVACIIRFKQVAGGGRGKRDSW